MHTCRSQRKDLTDPISLGAAFWTAVLEPVGIEVDHREVMGINNGLEVVVPEAVDNGFTLRVHVRRGVDTVGNQDINTYTIPPRRHSCTHQAVMATMPYAEFRIGVLGCKVEVNTSGW